ncbi:MAG: helix-turn-helix domain-containing protein [Acidobacteria bacterium]|nr:helix-turn-helix domain-containing protein [Acidobacteriota bacterium]
MDALKPSINDRMNDLIQEMIELNIRYVDASKEFEKLFISAILNKNGFNRSEAAQKLGIHRNTLTYKIKELKIKSGH